MKQYMLFILLISLITSCAPKVEIDIAKPVEETPKSEPIEITKEEPREIIQEKPEETSLEENTIEIKEDSFYPEEKTIEKDTEIKWINKDKKEHKIACYLKGNRVTTSSNLKQENSFTYTFLKEGDYTCIDAIYGLRSNITVKAKTALLSPTGAVIGSQNTKIKATTIIAASLIAIIVLLFFIYVKNHPS